MTCISLVRPLSLSRMHARTDSFINQLVIKIIRFISSVCVSALLRVCVVFFAVYNLIMERSHLKKSINLKSKMHLYELNRMCVLHLFGMSFALWHIYDYFSKINVWNKWKSKIIIRKKSQTFSHITLNIFYQSVSI